MNVDDLWYDRSRLARAVRVFVSPLSALYGSAVAIRNALYDRGLLRSYRGTIPVVSVGNVSVGGTGKTPFSAYLVRALIDLGHRPAVVMRGYGGDELQLHARMNPDVPIISSADRVAGICAAVDAGADVVVLDDGFQHRRAHRDLDIVLVSAEQWSANVWLLPAGPLREPMRSIRRADLVVVTQKSASDAEVQAVVRAIQPLLVGCGTVVVASLAPSELVSSVGGESLPLDAVRGERVLAVAGIGDPTSFFTQLRQLGALVTERRFRDHHPYTVADAEGLELRSRGHKYVVATEKDTVKLSAIWPANGPNLLYLSQAVRLREETSLVAAALAKLFNRTTSTVG